MDHNWFYARGNDRLGPVSYEQLGQLAVSSQLSPSDLVWNETMTEWSPAGDIPGLFPRTRMPPHPPKPRSIPPEWEVDYANPPHLPRRNASYEGEAGGITDLIMGVIDLKFKRHYTIVLVQLLWFGYLLVAAFILMFSLLSVFIPSAMLGLLRDLVGTFYDPSEETPNTGSRFSGRLGILFVVLLVLGFIGLNVRVSLETLAVHFRIADFLKEMNQARAAERGERPAG